MADRRGVGMLAGLGGCLVVLCCALAVESSLVVQVDRAVHAVGFEQRWPALAPLAHAVELIGQRGVVYPLAGAIVAALAWAVQRWRPLVLFGAALFVLNAAVGAAKHLLGREKPHYHEVELFNGGVIFPSGHAANVVLVWGLLAYVFLRYGRVTWSADGAVRAVTAAALAMGAASIYLDTHWVSDIVGGWLVGAVILLASVLLDQRSASAPPGADVPARRSERGDEVDA